jgi:hypothetical protein
MKTVVSVVAVLVYAFSSHPQLAITRPVDPVRTVIAAFDHVNLVGLGERHGALEDSQFRLRLIRDPEFSKKVNDIVIEFGNPLYRAVLDRFVDGDDVPYAELSEVWKNTTQRRSGAWNSPFTKSSLLPCVRSMLDCHLAGDFEL